ncbi:DUF6517 family protein [Halobacteria archaeon AArc-curdl1]|uniref:DUF6517 family protein n=1 Tax=Natronosalvus hydrolyticus TaxID=2979988 RepID=A0AAP2ZBY6_9EURY|nr:DUF6517 family protein [Halobacteria archaeon AArc-curdl1]
MNRRAVLASTGVVGLASLSGCLGLAGLDEHESKPAGVNRSVLDDTGYDQTGVEPLSIKEEFDAVLFSESVSVTNHMTEHDKEVEIPGVGSQRAATFVVLTTPQVSVLGRELNPVGEMSTRELVDLVADNYDNIGDPTPVGEEEVTVFGETTTMSRYSTQADFDGTELDVLMHVTTAVETEDDLLFTVGVYPEDLEDVEGDNIVALAEGVIEDAHE